VEAQQFTGTDRRLADALGKRVGAHAVLNCQYRRLELVPYRLVCRLGRIRGRSLKAISIRINPYLTRRPLRARATSTFILDKGRESLICEALDIIIRM